MKRKMMNHLTIRLTTIIEQKEEFHLHHLLGMADKINNYGSMSI
jgi:hypothetical protein